jgi:hypothetical protein
MWKANGKTTTLQLFLDSPSPKTEKLSLEETTDLSRDRLILEYLNLGEWAKNGKRPPPTIGRVENDNQDDQSDPEDTEAFVGFMRKNSNNVNTLTEEHFFNNKKFWEELITYFPFIRHGLHIK